MSAYLFATVLLGALFIAAMIGLSRVDAHAHTYATDGSGATSGYAATVDRIEAKLTEQTIFRVVGALTAILAVLVTVLVVDGVFELAGLVELVGDTAMIVLFVLLAIFLFASTYAASKRQNLGTAHALAAGLFLAGVVFIFFVAADLLIELTR